jgi:hypothetical protein
MAGRTGNKRIVVAKRMNGLAKKAILRRAFRCPLTSEIKESGISALDASSDISSMTGALLNILNARTAGKCDAIRLNISRKIQKISNKMSKQTRAARKAVRRMNIADRRENRKLAKSVKASDKRQSKAGRKHERFAQKKQDKASNKQERYQARGAAQKENKVAAYQARDAAQKAAKVAAYQAKKENKNENKKAVSMMAMRSFGAPDAKVAKKAKKVGSYQAKRFDRVNSQKDRRQDNKQAMYKNKQANQKAAKLAKYQARRN